MDNGKKNAAGTMLVCSAVVNWYSSRGSQKQNRKCTCSFRVIWSEKVKLGTFVSLKKQTSNLPVQWLIVIATIHPVFYNPCHMVQQLNVLCDKLSIEIWCLKQSIQPVMRWPVILIRAIPWMSFSLTAPPPLQSAFGFPSFHSKLEMALCLHLVAGLFLSCTEDANRQLAIVAYFCTLVSCEPGQWVIGLSHTFFPCPPFFMAVFKASI